MRLLTPILALTLAACGPSEGDIYEDLLTGERFQLDRVGECHFEYRVASGLAHRVSGMPRPIIVGTDSLDMDTCFGVRQLKGDELLLVLRPAYQLENSERYRKLN